MKKYYLILVLLIGCTTIVKKYKPAVEGEPSFYKKGMPFLEIKDDSKTYSYTIYNSTKEEILVLLDIKNNGPKTEIDSNAFSLVETNKRQKYKAQNPEDIIAGIDAKVAQEKESLEPNAFSATAEILDTTVTVLELATLFDHETEAQSTAREKRYENRENQEHRELERRERVEALIARLESNKRIVQEKYLRKTTLKKGESLQGLLLFRVNGSAGSWVVQNSNLKTITVGKEKPKSFSIREIEVY